ncbi:MAG: glycolate oxidase subunit GlcF [gamma proteobacterium endosymbiont of Lamellibrachia anaximandri]|nr:glycolate oxidase subunit GlcF [gamma proteobacterium endosymbiont of Lamellibrachia anaximandri]MBL3534651.1 glycolate oxidase subunit GlcF [gamma proteobacterium endosymbiont of Lamellibrachia anaximandri]
MQTRLSPQTLESAIGREAEQILRSCVHCGFCTATCPTYQLLGDELDGPRGRIYQIKQLLEGTTPTDSLQQHLDRCLSCRSCETTCPSGVNYSRLLEIGREHLERIKPRTGMDSLRHQLLIKTLPYPKRFGALLKLARAIKRLLPKRLRYTIPAKQWTGHWPEARHQRRMLILDGCVQPSLAPAINFSTARVLDQLGISLIRVPEAGCCGAVSLHLGANDAAKHFARCNIDAWLPLLKTGAEALVITASGCGQTVKEYPQLLIDDAEYAKKATIIAAATKDIGEVLLHEDLSQLSSGSAQHPPIAFHSPCTLQHGLGMQGVVEQLLLNLGYTLTTVDDAHLCCGSAGTYSLLQPDLSDRLRRNKLRNLQAGEPTLIATANIGCLNHLQAESRVPVKHWIELLDHSLPPS